MSTRARLRLLGNAASSLQQRIVAELASADLAIELDTPWGQPGLPADPCLVVFDRLTLEVLDELRDAGAWGRQRVLAIALPDATLENADAWSLLRSGASDVVRWDHRNPPAHDVAARVARWSEVDRLVRSDTVRRTLVGESPRWVAMLREVVEVAAFTQTSMLLTGESGTGKELVARLIHALDRRPDKGEFIVVDCTTVVPTLSGSEFFGHERGAFTGAVAARDGAFARANGGTLFLDEIGELPPPLQAELLRVIQEGMYKRVGSDTWRDTRFRLVCATNRPLRDAIDRGDFRADLYHRIAAWSCELPPLRGRREDIQPLALHFLSEQIPGLRRPRFDPAVADYLVHRDYPGNVRELRLLVARIAARYVGEGPISVGSLPEGERPEGGADAHTWWQGPFEEAVEHAVAMGVGLREIGRVARQAAVGAAVASEGGNLRRASGLLGVTERALQLRRSSGSLSFRSAETVPRRLHPETDRPPTGRRGRSPGRGAEGATGEGGGQPPSPA